MFAWKWHLKDLPPPDKDVKVLSCFSCGGGSSMGYKRVGFDVVGNVEIDPRINEMYIKNLHPRHNFNMDIRDFNKLTDIPDEIMGIDILDGSPPCTPFSTAGGREKTWGEVKKFAEGQVSQVLDDLFFVFLDTVEKLHPKIVVAENVVGLTMGNAQSYVARIAGGFKELGYDAQLFRLNSAFMDVPQVRERVFFIANRMGYPKLSMNFRQSVIRFGEVRTERGKPFKSQNSLYKRVLEHALPTDKAIAKARRRIGDMSNSGFNDKIITDDMVCLTVGASGLLFRYHDRMIMTDDDIRNVSTFPQDYDFCDRKVQFVCGMSVPPNMMAHIAMQIWHQWLDDKR